MILVQKVVNRILHIRPLSKRKGEGRNGKRKKWNGIRMMLELSGVGHKGKEYTTNAQSILLS